MFDGSGMIRNSNSDRSSEGEKQKNTQTNTVKEEELSLA